MNPREKEVYDFILEYIEEAGYPPTRREIASACGIASTSTVNRLLWSLVNKGFIKIPLPTSGRAIQIVEKAS